MEQKYFKQIVEIIYQKSPLQKKKLEKYLSTQDELFFESAEIFAQEYTSFLESQGIPLVFAVDAYLKMVKDMLKSQIYFMKTGKYPMESAEQAFDQIYNNEKEMTSFMMGLAISQFLWSTHYKMHQFLKKNLLNQKGNVRKYLEIGPGHGLFLKDAYQILGSKVDFVAIDISKASMDITKSILKFLVEDNIIKYVTMDILNYDENEKFDFITMGEVLEHVDFPNELLTKFNNLLSDNGVGFISTCVDCPTIDHVCHFKCVNEIREMLNNNNLIIKDELILPVEDLPMEEIVERKITINYCALVMKK